MGLTVHLVRSVPIVFDESVNIIIAEAYHLQLLAFLGTHSCLPLVELVDAFLYFQHSSIKVHLEQLGKHFYLLGRKVQRLEGSQGNLHISLSCLLPSFPEVLFLLFVFGALLL